MKTYSDLDRAIEAHMQAHRIVGLAACRLQDGQIVWANGYGWADIANRKPMTPDVILNIGSISKTFTCTALMQLWEQGKFQLDDPVNGYLPFKVRHPLHTNPITFRHLLTHTSAIQDSPANETSYSVGDPVIALGDWLQDYLTPEGKYYEAEENFLPYAPGADWNYSNVAFGLLGYLCECLSGEPLFQYTRRCLFEPLGMLNTGWMLKDIELTNHAIPYGLPELASMYASLCAEQASPATSAPIPLRLYSFPNYPDGLVRTSARQLAMFGAVFTASGEQQGYPLLKAATVQRCFSREWSAQNPNGISGIQGLAWHSLPQPDGACVWEHTGGDPGINTCLAVRPEDGAGIVILTNTNHTPESMNALAHMLWKIEVYR